jgi:hypothetical protein
VDDVTTPDAALIPDAAESENVRLVGYHDLAGRPGFKMAAQLVDDRWYLYVAHFWDSGWSVVDVTDPTEPRTLSFVPGPPNTWTLQVQAADGLLVTALEHPERGWGFDVDKPSSDGVLLFDIATDPAHPRQIGTWRSGGRGTHRNHYAGGRYAYLAANVPGYRGNILVVLDLSDPCKPVEAARWWLDGQQKGAGQDSAHDHYLHGPAFVDGSRAYLGYGSAGLVVLDVSDVEKPRLEGHLPFAGMGSIVGCHSAVPLPGSDVIVVNSEAIRETGDVEPYNYTYTVDVSNPARPFVLGSFAQPSPSSHTGLVDYFAKGGRFGPHNQHHPQGAHLFRSERYVAMTYFNAGLRLFDVRNPRAPREVGHFVPADPHTRRGVLPKTLVTQFEDVLIDARGYIFCTDKNHGLFVLESPLLADDAQR